MWTTFPFEALIIAAVSGAAIGAYWLVDRNRDMERHFQKCDSTRYYILLLTTAVLGIAFAFHMRHVVGHFFKMGIKRLKL